MVHHGQGLPLGFEPIDHPLRVHAGANDLQRHLPLDRLLLFGQEHDAHAPFAELFQQSVRPDVRAGLFRDMGWSTVALRWRGPAKEVARLAVSS